MPLASIALSREPERSRFAPARVETERLPDGGLILRSPIEPLPPARCVTAWLEAWARTSPDRTFLAEPVTETSGRRWREMSYREVWRAVRSCGQAILDRGLSPERPVLILAENGIDHALFALGAMHVGFAVAPVSTAYARLSLDFGKLRYILDLLGPELIYVDDASRYRAALNALDLSAVEIVTSQPDEARATTPFAGLLRTEPTEAVERANQEVGPDTTAKILFTSGSTDLPKGVINTHRMLCSNQESIAQLWPFLERSPPVVVDWLPWSHTFGGNHDFNLVLRNGGTLYIDEGKPVPALFGQSVANLKAVAPTMYLNVPRGFAFLLDELEADPDFNRHFFSRLELVFYAAAALPQNLWTRLEACSLAARGEIVPMVSSWGMTETAPMSTSVHWTIDRAGVIGLPAPGTEVRLDPVDGRFEILVRGPNVTPGYYKDAAKTAAAFHEGWLRTGDAARPENPDDLSRGIVFDGRIAENFKLTSATWVNVGILRVALLARAPLLTDAVIAGHDRDEVTAIGFPNLATCRDVAGLEPEASTEEVLAHPAVRDAIAAALARHNAAMPGNSTAVARAILAAEPPSIDANEITDKGYINQRAVLRRRADLVERLYAASPDPAVIVAGASA